MTDCKELRRQIIDVCLWLEKNGLVFGTWGNVSVKLDGGNILITPSRISYENMTEDDFVVLSPDGERISGERSITPGLTWARSYICIRRREWRHAQEKEACR